MGYSLTDTFLELYQLQTCKIDGSHFNHKYALVCRLVLLIHWYVPILQVDQFSATFISRCEWGYTPTNLFGVLKTSRLGLGGYSSILSGIDPSLIARVRQHAYLNQSRFLHVVRVCSRRGTNL